MLALNIYHTMNPGPSPPKPWAKLEPYTMAQLNLTTSPSSHKPGLSPSFQAKPGQDNTKFRVHMFRQFPRLPNAKPDEAPTSSPVQPISWTSNQTCGPVQHQSSPNQSLEPNFDTTIWRSILSQVWLSLISIRENKKWKFIESSLDKHKWII